MTTKKRTPEKEAAAPRPKAKKAAATKPAAPKRAAKGPRIHASYAAARSASRAPEKPKRRVAPAAKKAPLAAPRRPPGSKRTPQVSTTEPSAEARGLAVALASAGIEKKAIGIEILDVCGRVDYADFLVVMTGRSDRHVAAIATGIEEALRLKGVAAISIEGLQTATWVLLDFGDVVVHVFQEDARVLYDIEGLWIDASRVPVPADEPPLS